ncbi:stalk domain-containing protein [Paenibacillus puerhi]|uniref:stalk domain-containing protein n=1 Tax=Paenibacillus puerhi TaxID=2692622 RepID=UPI00135A384A|nr:stalk domain-containing protein [Paenibacillus puerhi]
MKKTHVILLLFITAMLSLATGALAASNLTEIKAYLNSEIKFRLDGKPWRPVGDNGEEVLPITYNGTTYLPLRVVANAFDIPIAWESSTQTVSMRESSNLTLYSKEVKVDNWSEKFYDIADKKQLVFGNRQYDGAYAFTAENVGLGWYEGSPYLKFNFGKPYNTLHLTLYSPSSMKVRVMNGSNQQLTEEISLEADRVTELDVDLQGSPYALVSAYDAAVQAEKPLLYILKDSYVTTAAIPVSLK